MNLFQKNRDVFVAFLLLGFIIYLPVIGGEFLNWDDEAYITKNDLFKSLTFSTLIDVFSTFVMGNYHPLTMLTYTIEFYLFNDFSIPFHINNILLHITNSYLVFLFINLLFNKRAIAIIGGTVFLIHPLHVESVAWIAERKDVLYSFFLLLGIIQYHKYIIEKKEKFYVYSILLMIFSCLSKGQAVVFSAFVVLLDMHYKTKMSAKYLIKLSPFIFISIIFGVVAVIAQKNADAVNIGVEHHYSYLQRFVLVAFGFCNYFFKSLIPYNLSAVYPYPFSFKESIPTYYYFYLLFCLFFAVYWVYTYISNHKNQFLGLSIFIISLFPVLQIFPVGEAIMADRYMYIPLLGIIIFIISLFNSVNFNRFITYTLFFAFIGYYSFISFNRSSVWSTKKVFWETQIKQQPDYGKGYNNLGAYYYEEKDTLKAIDYFVKAIEKEYHLAIISLAVVEKDRGNYNKSIELYKSVMNKYPDNIGLWKGLTLNYISIKNYKNALTCINKGISVNPSYDWFYIKKGDVYFLNKDFESAVNEYNKAVSIRNQDPIFYYNRGKAKIEINDVDGAIADINEYLKYHNDNEALLKIERLKNINANKSSTLSEENKLEHLIQKGYSLFSIGDYKNAQKVFEKIVTINQSSNMYNNLGLCFQKQNKLDSAIIHYSNSIKIDSAFEEAYYNRGRTYMIQNNAKNAILDFSKAIEINQTYSAAYKFRGVCFLSLNKNKEACIDYKKAVEFNFKGDLSMFKHCD